MYSRKSVGPRMEPWGTPALTGYSCEDFPSRTTQSHLLLRKEEIRPNIWPEIPEDLSLWRRAACQTLSKALDISSALCQGILYCLNLNFSMHLRVRSRSPATFKMKLYVTALSSHYLFATKSSIIDIA